MNHLNQEQKPQAIHSPECTLNTQSKLRSPTYPQNQTLGVQCSSRVPYIHLTIQDNILFTWAHFLFLLCIWMAAIDVKNSSEGKSSGSFVKNWAIWMKSILVKISSKSFNIPRAVRNKNSSPSRQNTSQTRQAKSSGKDLLYNVNILKNRAKFSQLLDKKNVSDAQKSTDCSLASLTLLKYEYSLCISELLLLVAA